MERFAWKGIIIDGQKEEYIRVHDEIIPEMTAALNDAGIHNYSIWNLGNEVFGYYECESVEEALNIQAKSEVVARWEKEMSRIMTMVSDEKGETARLVQVFYHV